MGDGLAGEFRDLVILVVLMDRDDSVAIGNSAAISRFRHSL